MKIYKTAIPEVKILKPTAHGDERGFFMETFRQSWLPDFNFVQDNHSRSAKGTLRGLHYQLNKPQGKLVRVIEGSVFDVAVDIRRSSQFFGKYVCQKLTAENKEMFWIPPGFAHGFLVTSEAAQFVYKCTSYYSPEDERSIRWDDPEISIAWPSLTETPLLSVKDQIAPNLISAEVYD